MKHLREYFEVTTDNSQESNMAYTHTYLMWYLSVRMFTCLSAGLPVRLPVCMSIYLVAGLPAILSICLPVCQPVCVHVCMCACLSAWLPVSHLTQWLICIMLNLIVHTSATCKTWLCYHYIIFRHDHGHDSWSISVCVCAGVRACVYSTLYESSCTNKKAWHCLTVEAIRILSPNTFQ